MVQKLTLGEANAEVQRSLPELERQILEARRHYFAARATPEASLKEFNEFTTGRLKEALKQKIDDNREILEDIICVKMRYCSVSKSSPAAMVLAFVDGVIDAHVGLLASFPIPGVTLAAYLLKVGILDDFCKCPITQPPPTSAPPMSVR